MNDSTVKLIGLLSTNLRDTFTINGVIIQNDDKVLRFHVQGDEEKEMEVLKSNIAGIIIEPLPEVPEVEENDEAEEPVLAEAA